jgi:hypothetical protein
MTDQDLLDISLGHDKKDFDLFLDANSSVFKCLHDVDIFDHKVRDFAYSVWQHGYFMGCLKLASINKTNA